jgi:SAM-dependent methyltransferase
MAYAFDRAFKTGRRRSEFEHKYRSRGDYFEYRTSPYEALKYDRTFAALEEWAGDAQSVLEIGCSVGVFTKRLSERFAVLTAVDIAQEALVLAAREVGEGRRVSFVRTDAISLHLNRTFDLILCAEVLMYVPEKDAARLMAVLDRHLAPGGVLVEVAPQDRLDGAPKFFQGWDAYLARQFHLVERRQFDDPVRPYELVFYRKQR